MRVYLDNCIFNRPFDDQSHIRIRLEAEAKLYIQQQIREQKLELVWSYILEFENAQNPYHERQHAIQTWKDLAAVDIEESPVLLDTARILVAQGIKPKDALHVACAVEGQADYFISTDDKLLKKIQTIPIISALNPMDYIKELPHETTH
ncbi:PIN domain-containing protein [Thiolinea disciformis]|uniref:PIN domain-containing protein n=1 Tax=Thiolinea disciformis TaxID=125614 RepID=UPI0003753EC6|nr:PIN domain-containing protein [Thiolinea disciformis]